MSYELQFHQAALREWKKLDRSKRSQLQKKIAERLVNPHVPADRLRDDRPRYKIKLRKSGFRLVYEVRDDRLVVLVLAVGKRERSKVYRKASTRSP